MSILEQISVAIGRQEYQRAAQLTEALLEKSPNHPWGLFYVARLHEVHGREPAAESIYRQLLRDTAIPKVALQARQGLQRLETAQSDRRHQAITEATRDPHNASLGFFILEPITGEARLPAAQHFARIMNLDPYNVRLTLPSQGWQLYRTGAIGELQVYQQELESVDIPAFCVSLEAIAAIPVYRVEYIVEIQPTVTVMCRNDDNELGSFQFDWSEVSQQVKGQVPIFEQVIDRGAWGKLERKERTQDYGQFIDLHLHSHNCIIRFCDQTYQFQDGIVIHQADAPDTMAQTSVYQSTTRIAWNNLQGYLDQQLPNIPVCANFRAFGETTRDYQTYLERLNAHIDLTRKINTHWDAAFHLYSALAYVKTSPRG